jgi:hypothetical protein
MDEVNKTPGGELFRDEFARQKIKEVQLSLAVSAFNFTGYFPCTFNPFPGHHKLCCKICHLILSVRLVTPIEYSLRKLAMEPMRNVINEI